MTAISDGSSVNSGLDRRAEVRLQALPIGLVRLGDERADRPVVDQVDVAPGGVVVVAGVGVLVGRPDEERIGPRRVEGQFRGLEVPVLREHQAAGRAAGIALLVVDPDDHAELLAGLDRAGQRLPVLLRTQVVLSNATLQTTPPRPRSL